MRTTQVRFIAKYLLTGGMIGLLTGFFIGRNSIKIAESIEYVKGDTVTDTVHSALLLPYLVEIPGKPIYLYKKGTTDIDTAAIIKDWTQKRSYNPVVFDNDNGKLTIDASIQYNSLSKLSYSFTPIHKVITKVIEPPKLSFYVGTSYNTLGYAGIGGGLFYKHAGLGFQYVTNLEKKGIQFDLKYKF